MIGLIKCIFGFHTWKTTGFYRNRPLPHYKNGTEGDFELSCEYCSESKYVKEGLKNHCITEIIKKDNEGWL